MTDGSEMSGKKDLHRLLYRFTSIVLGNGNMVVKSAGRSSLTQKKQAEFTRKYLRHPGTLASSGTLDVHQRIGALVATLEAHQGQSRLETSKIHLYTAGRSARNL